MNDLVTAAQQQNADEEAASYAVAHAAISTMHQVGGDDNINMKQPSVVTHSQQQAPSSRPKKIQKIKFPPPSNELIFGHNENDVLLGRGATTNIHPGNIHFRNICAAAKPNFAVATNSEKRQIAIETAQHVMAMDPPGRFLERVEDGDINIHEDGTGTFDGLGGAYSNVDVHSLMSPSDAKYLNESGWAQNKASKHWKKALGPWRDVGMEKAVQKTCAVIRDHKRQDRIALKAMGMLKKNSKKTNLLGYSSQVQPGELQAVATQPADPGGIIPTQNDIIIGRGAFINSHIGNIQFRAYCSERKERFDSSTPAEKRACALEVINLVKQLVPPARFLKRDPRALQQAVPTGDGSYRLPPRGLEGPWEEVPHDKACAKTIQVLRDLKMREEPQPPAPVMPTGHEMTAAHLLLPPHVDNGMNYQAYEQPIHLSQIQEPEGRGMEESLPQVDPQFHV
eukprot:scaffold8921_cov81-Skeletonema_dohrnii-CCMP3373.AAC.2